MRCYCKATRLMWTVTWLNRQFWQNKDFQEIHWPTVTLPRTHLEWQRSSGWGQPGDLLRKCSLFYGHPWWKAKGERHYVRQEYQSYSGTVCKSVQLRPQLHTVQDPRTRVLPCQGLRSQSLIFGCLEKEKYNESIYYLENRQGHLMVTVGKGLLRNGKMRLNELCSFTREIFSTKLSLPVKARSVQDQSYQCWRHMRSNWQYTAGARWESPTFWPIAAV